MKMRWHYNLGDWQIIWWGRWIGLGTIGPWPQECDADQIYASRFRLGFAELRRFAP